MLGNRVAWLLVAGCLLLVGGTHPFVPSLEGKDWGKWNPGECDSPLLVVGGTHPFVPSLEGNDSGGCNQGECDSPLRVGESGEDFNLTMKGELLWE